MHYKAVMTTSDIELHYWGEDLANRIVRSQLGDELKRYLTSKLTFTLPKPDLPIDERSSRPPLPRHIESNFIFMPMEHWQDVKGTLTRLCFHLPEAYRAVIHDAINEIENR